MNAIAQAPLSQAEDLDIVKAAGGVKYAEPGARWHSRVPHVAIELGDFRRGRAAGEWIGWAAVAGRRPPACRSSTPVATGAVRLGLAGPGCFKGTRGLAMDLARSKALRWGPALSRKK